MEENDKIKEEFEKYLKKLNRKDEFYKGDGKVKSKIANEYVRDTVSFDDKPTVITALNKIYSGHGPFPNRGKNSDEDTEGKICSPDDIYNRIE